MHRYKSGKAGGVANSRPPFVPLSLTLYTSSAAPRVLRCRALPDHLKARQALDDTGARLFYAACPGTDARIWSMVVASGEVREVTRGARPMPAPAGDLLAYQSVSGGPTSPPSLFVTQRRGPGEPVSSAISSPIHTAWSLDGKRIAYLGPQVNPSAGGEVAAVASVSGGRPHESMVPGTAGGDYRGVGWISSTEIALAAIRRDTNNQAFFEVNSYGLADGTVREILPFDPSQVLVTYGSVSISEGAKRIFWQVPPDDGGTYKLADLGTGRSVAIQFPEEVDPSLSPEGTRVLAVGRKTGALCLAWLSTQDSQWHVEQLQLK